MDYIESLFSQLIAYSENEWLEFKHNNYEPFMIGKDISALANGATFTNRKYAYMIWGVEDSTKEIVGTSFNFGSAKKGNEGLECWLRSMLSDNADFEWDNFLYNGKNICILIINKAINQPVMFQKTEYIREGSHTKLLNDVPTMKTVLWNKLRNDIYEDLTAKCNLSLVSALQLLDYSAYFDARKVPIPTNAEQIEHYLLEEGFLEKQDDGFYSITNLGAILYAKQIHDFPKLERKALRIVQYKGNNRLEMLKEEFFDKGYAVVFDNVIKYIEALIPAEEVIDGGLRKTNSSYPILAIREAVANALIHQDFCITGSSPTVEIFDKRIEITNPGTPLVDIKRIVDNPPKSRNEKLAAIMRRLGICEEMGSGWDKMVISCEIHQQPAPQIMLYEDSTRVILYSEKTFNSLTLEEKIWACYMHACIKQIQGEQITNSSLRLRFGVPESSAGSISRLIKECVEKGIIKPLDPTTAPKHMRYTPYWA